jgi:hypothetical protein
MDAETPGLMQRRPRPRSESIMTKGLMVTVGLVCLYIAVCLDAMIAYGHSHYGSYAIGSSIALTAFALLIVVTAFESRNQTGTTLTMETLDNRTMNRIGIVQILLAVLLTQADFLIRILGTTRLDLAQFSLALLPPIGLYVLWELGKLIARRSRARPRRRQAPPAPSRQHSRSVASRHPSTTSATASSAIRPTSSACGPPCQPTMHVSNASQSSCTAPMTSAAGAASHGRRRLSVAAQTMPPPITTASRTPGIV